MSDAWAPLMRELDAWRAEGRVASFWWRDDDTQAPTAALDRLLGLQARHAVPLALAVVPYGLDRHLADVLERCEDVVVLQHGYAHQNHGAPRDKRIELGPQRPAELVIGELAQGRQILERLPRARPVLVPPWNRIAPHLIPVLPELGYVGLSTFAPRARPQPVAGLTQVNSHVDPIDWRGDRGCRGTGPVLTDAVGHLTARRTGAADADEPTGLLTHHLAHDAATWALVEGLLARLVAHPAARPVAVDDMFARAA